MARTTPLFTRLFWHVGLGLGVVVVIAPFAWMISTSLKPVEEIYSLSLIPGQFQWGNYAKVFTTIPMLRFLLNTVFVTAVVMAARLTICAMCAYALARLKFKGRDLFFMMMLATMMIPGEIQLVPGFVLMKWLGWLDTYKVLIIPRIESIIMIFLMRQFFLTIPKELEEAAVIDGSNKLGILWHVILPLSRPVIAVVTLFTFQAMWNDFMWPLIMTNSTAMKPLQVGLALLNTQLRENNLNLLMAATVVSILPVLVVFLSAQRTFIRGIALTGIKG
ncbi:MAG: carbohydrate ABC transporter permease [Candidatus Latescibacteria bacterium]|nr:carbohydrate ABC transporter permease [Candidatus Latescibacterota bacterium]